jgi:hypothetical protein
VQIPYTYQAGEQVRRGSIELPASDRAGFRSCFVFAFPRSGSVLVNNVVTALAAECDVPAFDVPGHFHAAGIDFNHWQCDWRQLFPEYGYCFTGFRYPPSSIPIADLASGKRKLLIVRDPRDILVSLYYSIKLSHHFASDATPQFAEGIGRLKREVEGDIDSFCLGHADTYRVILRAYMDIVRSPDTLILRYEDFIYDKVGLARSISDWFLLDVPPDRLRPLVASQERVPETDQPDSHIRQVHPGDHRRKLRPETVTALDGILVDFLNTFGYAPSPPNSTRPSAADVQSWQAQLGEARQELARLQTYVGKVSAERDALSVHIGELQQRATRLELEREQLSSQLAELGTCVAEIEADRAARLKVIVEQASHLAELQRQLDVQKAQEQTLLGAIETLRSQVADLRTCVPEIEADRAARLEVIVEQASHLAELQRQLLEAERQSVVQSERLAKLSHDLAIVGRSRWLRLGRWLRLTKLRTLLEG